MGEGRGRETRDALLVALVAFLPFVRGAIAGRSLYFRDLSVYFLPLRRFALDGLRAGEVRFFNPYVHEGVPLSLPALGYPLDLLQLLRPDEAGISLLLVLHVPLAALAFFTLARRLGLARPAAAGGGLVYALGGFLLSSVNLYVYVQAAAWAPLLVLGLVRVAGGEGRRAVAATAVVLAVALSTTAVEIVAQGLLIGLVLGSTLLERRKPVVFARLFLSLALGVAAAAPVLLLLAGQVTGSARDRGFPADVVLSHSIHPFALVQVIVGGLFGDMSNLASEWWGENFFPRGFPYVLSLYLGVPVLALAAAGAATSRPLARRLLALGALFLLVSLGRWAGLSPLVEAVPAPARMFRFPVKAFFTVHFALALLAALGLDRLGRALDGKAWRPVAGVAGAMGAALSATPLLPHLFPGAMASFARAFLPPGQAPEVRTMLLERVLGDAAAGGMVALALAAVALLALRSTLSPSRAAALSVTLVAADLLRTGAGLNPMVTPAFFRPSPELAARLGALREGRVFTCSLDESPAYLAARRARPTSHEVWSFATALETLTPALNVPLAVATALSPDLTMLVPEERILSPAEASCRDLDAIVPRLRAAGVHAVLSVDPLSHPDLEPDGAYAPGRLLPLRVNVYRLRGALPRLELRGAGGGVARVEADGGKTAVVVDADRAGLLVVRDAWAPGWSACVDGRPAGVVQVDRRYVGVRLPAGRRRVVLRYRPRRLGPALGAAAAAAAVLIALSWTGRRTGHADAGPTSRKPDPRATNGE